MKVDMYVCNRDSNGDLKNIRAWETINDEEKQEIANNIQLQMVRTISSLDDAQHHTIPY